MHHHDNDMSANGWPFSKYPPGYFGLRELLGPVIRDLLEWRLGWNLPERIQGTLHFINMLLVELIDDDELGLIGASPEERVRFAASLEDAQ
jgi:hypothetical protein